MVVFRGEGGEIERRGGLHNVHEFVGREFCPPERTWQPEPEQACVSKRCKDIVRQPPISVDSTKQADSRLSGARIA